MSGCASIGFRLHTGWAMLVAVAAEGEVLLVLRRCRVEMLPPGRGRFVYHEAAELPLPDAESLIESVRRIVEDTARTALGSAIHDLKVTGASIPTGPASVPDDLAAVLRSRRHAGTLTSRRSSCASETYGRASANAGMAEADLKAAIDAFRKALGAPWTRDHKIATAAAHVRA